MSLSLGRSYSYPDSESFDHKALLLRKLRKIRKYPRFLLDLWRFDYFPLTDPDEESVKPYQRKVEGVDWPSTAEILSSHLTFMSFEMLFRKRVSTFGILPMTDVTKKSTLRSARRNLMDYYRYASKQAMKNNHAWINHLMSAGHGARELTETKVPKCVFQYDQVDPILNQEYKKSISLADLK